MKQLAWGLGCVMALAGPAAAQEQAYAYSGTTLRAGPAADYPEVAPVWRGDEVSVHGCVVQWSWCDVSHGDERGWMPSTLIDFAIPVTSTALKPLQAVTFVLDDYWNAHYADRRWSRDRAHWRVHAPPASGAVPGRIAERIAPLQWNVAREESTGTPMVPPPPAWVPPGDRMNSQLPPPDAINPRYNKKMRDAGAEAPKEWWLLPPQYLINKP